MSVDGASGRLFTVSDDLSNSLFSVNTIAGLPVIEAFATNDVFLGKYNTYPIKTVASGTLAVITGSISGSVAAPGSTTQIVYNNGGVLGANSGLVYSSSRVGIGTSTPSYTLDTSGYGRFTSGVVVNAGQRVSLGGSDYGSDALYSAGGGPLNVRGYYYTRFTKADATLGPQVIQVEGQSLLKGSGTTSATTALLVQNANASASLSITDDRIVTIPIQLSVSQINSTVVGGDVTFNNRITFNTFAPTSGATVSFSNGSRLSFLSGGPQNAVTRLDLNTTLQNNSAGSVKVLGL